MPVQTRNNIDLTKIFSNDRLPCIVSFNDIINTARLATGRTTVLSFFDYTLLNMWIYGYGRSEHKEMMKCFHTQNALLKQLVELMRLKVSLEYPDENIPSL